MQQHVKVEELVTSAYAAASSLPPAEARLMRDVATRLSVTFVALTESMEQRKAIKAERDEKNKQVVDLAVEVEEQRTIMSRAANDIAYAIFNLSDKKLDDLKPGIIESTCPTDTALIAERELRNASERKGAAV